MAQAQTVVQPFALSDVKLLPSRFQRNMQRDSAWIASIPVNRLLHSFRNTAGVYSALEGGYDAGKDDLTHVALLYGPIVLGGRLADVEKPFSDPTKHNDYYTFDYGKHPDVRLGTVKHLGGLCFENSDGTPIQPFYDLQHCRYVVYWKK